jgi:hypothetical protein
MNKGVYVMKHKNITKKEDDDQQGEEPVSDFNQPTREYNGWTEHRDGDVVKLEPGQEIIGILLNKSISLKYNDCGIYKIQVKDDPIPKVILGSKQLDRMMFDVNTGVVVRIVFEGTRPTDKGNAMKVFKVFTQG